MPTSPMPRWAGGGRRRQPFVRSRWSAARLVPLAAVAVFLAWVATPPGLPSGPLTGKTRVIDGDTLEVDNRRVRLAGIDAPERAQQCAGASGEVTDCGKASSETLRKFVGAGPLACVPIEMDRYGRVVATCTFADADLGEVMVLAGQAVAHGRYAELENEARLARRGIWAGTFDRPSEWRHAHQVDDASGAPDWPVISLVNWVRTMFFR